MRVIAVIKDRAVIEPIVQHLAEDAEAPMVRAGARFMRRGGVIPSRREDVSTESGPR